MTLIFKFSSSIHNVYINFIKEFQSIELGLIMTEYYCNNTIFKGVINIVYLF